MNELVLLRPKLLRLKLSGILETIEERIRQASEEKWSYSQFLLTLFSDEVDRRECTQLGRRVTRSGLDPAKTLETFDFTFNPKIHEPTIRQLGTGDYIEKNACVFFLGPSGVGKSHLAQALGHEACRRGYDVIFKRTSSLLLWIASGEGDGTRDRRLNQIMKIPLLILDDFGLKTISEAMQEDLYEIICERYEKKTTIITSNRDFNEWTGIFSNSLMASAAMDRLVHHAIKIEIEGKSYRLNDFVETTKELTMRQKN